MPIFCVKSVKIYTGQKKFTRIYPWDPWQIRGMNVYFNWDGIVYLEHQKSVFNNNYCATLFWFRVDPLLDHALKRETELMLMFCKMTLLKSLRRQETSESDRKAHVSALDFWGRFFLDFAANFHLKSETLMQNIYCQRHNRPRR